EEAQQKWRAKSGNVIVLEPSTGRILAMANVPSFDPNEFNKEKNLNAFFNHSVSSRYEPGSVFKVFTMAAGLESGAVTSETTYYDSGEVKIGPHIIRNAGNSAPRKNITMTRVLERSYNIGAVFVAMKTGKDFLRDFFLQKFRFEAKTGIDLPSELGSDFKNLESPEGRDINFATASFGQGIAVTPIKLVESFAAFANGGQLMKPYVVEEIQWPSGKIEKIVPKVIGQSVREDTVRALIPMMEAVVHGEYGSGKLAKVSGYRIAGKTGTGEIPFAEGRGYSERVNHTFVGFGPTSDPRAIILVRLEEPIGARYAEATAVPIFRELMKFILRYYEVLPDDVNGGGR
ncbi:MAG: penicillin-binding protein 2, partial [Parcubacteria group bacterium]|nr:penicillin-binding protein 2 [Parcubacteria group bacterium]